MDNYNLKETWAHEDAVIRHLARQLLEGRLALFIGAGTSAFYNLPSWSELVNRLCSRKGVDGLKDGENPIDKIEALKLTCYKRDQATFIEDVRSALYDGLAIDFDTIRKGDLLAAIGALAMASKRGSASKIITLNFDDLLELYLEFHGFVVDSVYTDKHWAGAGDVTVFHPHGFLPFDRSRPASEEIVFGTGDYVRITGERSLWRPALQSILRTHTTIYIGLSGTDRHLQALVGDLRDSHPYREDRLAYHGIRFSTHDDEDIGKVMETFAVKTQVLEGWEELPRFLFKICQVAKQFRDTVRTGL